MVHYTGTSVDPFNLSYLATVGREPSASWGGTLMIRLPLWFPKLPHDTINVSDHHKGAMMFNS